MRSSSKSVISKEIEVSSEQRVSRGVFFRTFSLSSLTIFMVKSLDYSIKLEKKFRVKERRNRGYRQLVEGKRLR